MKKFYILFFFAISVFCNAQTNVSGGIFSNTTWTLAGSPYIVVDTTAVFPGVTLTIDPGVVVKFDNGLNLEIRQGTLIANGTVADSITFTSNNAMPARGIWGGIYLNGALTNTSFNFCNIKYANTALNTIHNMYFKNSNISYNNVGINSVNNMTIDSCIFSHDGYGIANLGSSTLNFCTLTHDSLDAAIGYTFNATLNNCVLDSNNLAMGDGPGNVIGAHLVNCSISHNNSGIGDNGFIGSSFKNCIINYNSIQAFGFGINGNDTILNCEIKYNGTAINIANNVLITHCDIEYNTIGIRLNAADPNIHCNKICNNTSYDLKMNVSVNVNVANNYWCTTDSASTEAVIYDAYDNAAEGIVSFMPLDTTNCYLTTMVNEKGSARSFSVFPNPAADFIAVECSANLQKIILYSADGRVLKSIINPNSSIITIDVHDLTAGIYFLEAVVEEGREVLKVVKY